MAILDAILGSPIERLQSKNESILDVFTKTVTELEANNAKALAQTTKREQIIKTAQSEIDVLTALKLKNDTVITKINKIFE